ncbi:hypothetical protein OAP63_12415 [Vibrio sp.]|uniref:Uncharacterized protein n=1 Tax=Vibrio viridaestus TaxID=2487322 RepID=A0A3N9TH38_9VIBR|nr:hypothetical protein [Vibrio viridaestus]MDC0611535.1 hypothetical protein [Vibrio sp.]RQW63174.1 hypothetical protein EES38_07930 [Vibrio viridaestus]
MDPVRVGSSTSLYSPQSVKSHSLAKPQSAEQQASSLMKVEDNKVTLSDEGKALLEALKQIDKEGKVETKDKTVGDKVESFTYGALGMEHPDKMKEDDDSSYSAGQYLSAAATVGTILLALV